MIRRAFHSPSVTHEMHIFSPHRDLFPIWGTRHSQNHYLMLSYTCAHCCCVFSHVNFLCPVAQALVFVCYFFMANIFLTSLYATAYPPTFSVNLVFIQLFALNFALLYSEFFMSGLLFLVCFAAQSVKITSLKLLIITDKSRLQQFFDLIY